MIDKDLEILKQKNEHNTDSPECWCNPKQVYVPEADSYITVHEPEERLN